MVYLITYDLNSTGQKYDKVIQAIKDASTGRWCTYWKSSFLIRSSLTSAHQVFDRIKPYLDTNDTLFVAEITRNYSGWMLTDAWKYIENMI